MPTYDEVASIIPTFKRAAIDAYMRTQHVPWEIDGDEYGMSSSSASYTVSRPGADGEGGGDWSSNNLIANLFTGGSQDDSYQEAFETIRSRIDAAIDPWLSLPDPDAIATEVEECRQVTRGLSGAAAASDGGQVGAGIIPGNIALIMENSSAMAGMSIAAFKSRFVAQLGPVIGGHHGISLVLGAAIAAEEGIWEAARQNVADIVEAGRSGAQSLADSGSTPDYKVALKVAGWAVKGAGLFAGAAKPALEVVGLGITILEGTVAAGDDAVINGEDAEAVLEAFEKALKKVNDQIVSEETQLNDNLNTNLANIDGDRSSYDLSVPPVTNDAAGDFIAYTPGLITEITQTYMPAISTELSTLSKAAYGASMTPVHRDDALGIGANGPSSNWYLLRNLLRELLENLSWDVAMGAKNLDLVLQEFQNYEAGIAKEIDDFLVQLDRGNPTDPWD